MLDLISSGNEYIFANLVAIKVVHHALCIEMSELHREGFEGVTIRNVILNSLLKFFIGKSYSAHSFHLIVREC
jgi:hypothetical protein